jgi:hypothetical protein
MLFMRTSLWLGHFVPHDMAIARLNAVTLVVRIPHRGEFDEVYRLPVARDLTLTTSMTCIPGYVLSLEPELEKAEAADEPRADQWLALVRLL